MKEKRLRILWNSNAPWSTSGYGQQTAELLPLIRDEGYPLASSNFFGQTGGKFLLDGVMQYPVINHTYGSDAMVHHARDFKADVVFALQDQWVLNPQDLQQVPRYIPVTPVDHDPITRGVLNNLRLAYRVVTYAKHGQKELARNGISSTYIPHTVNTEIFKPMNTPERKQQAGLPPDCYLVGMVAANKDNPPRKSFQEAIDAFKMFLEKEPKAILYIHSNPHFPGGFDFKSYADFIGIGNKLLMPDAYQMNFNIDKEAMSRIYNTFDVLLAPSISEGFGIPIIEAQSCGIPVITNNFTSMPELVKKGITGEIVDLIKGPSGKRWSPQGSYMGIPDTLSLFDCMMKVYRADRDKMKKACREWIVANYDTKTVFKKKWIPYLELLEAEIYGIDKHIDTKDNIK